MTGPVDDENCADFIPFNYTHSTLSDVTIPTISLAHSLRYAWVRMPR